MKKKISCLLIILTILIVKTPLDVFAANDNNQIPSRPSLEQTELDGKIGEWDPNDKDKPNFDTPGLELEGNKPNEGDYFTISVTVPLNMEFIVLPSSYSAFGFFSSAEYTVKNNGSKNIVAKVESFDVDTSIVQGEDETPLYIEPIVGADKRTQMELKLTAIDEVNKRNNKDIDLYRLGQLNDSEKTLFNLQGNESRKVKFSSERWELPKYESKKESAKSGYTLGLEFSIANP